MKTTFATRHLAVRTTTVPEAVIEARGELDLAGAPTFRAAVGDLDVSSRRRVVLDLGRLTFIDGAGLHAVLDLYDECVEVSTALTILPGPRQVQRVFELTGADEFLPLMSGRNPTPDRRDTNDTRRNNGSQ